VSLQPGANIVHSHWQLRHLITNPEPDLLYYVSRNDVYCLNTAANLRAHIAVLPFAARCTASGFGWICVAGGDGNHIAIIRLDSNDMRVPGEYGGMHSRNRPDIKIEQMGSDIINSISIHKLQGNEEAGTTSDVVAVLTNNDRTVRIFSLTLHSQNSVMDLAFAVNHATISPDGRTLVAVGDHQQAYFYERVDLKPSPDYKSQKPVSAHCMWELVNIADLHVPRDVAVAGYFTTAWSPSGRHCSVSSELGYVTILDVEALKWLEDSEEATVAVVPSTRPDATIGPGGVRTTAFSPQPWDLFIWSEDQGRVCVADLRTGLSIRQVLFLDPEAEGLRHVEIQDHPANPYARPPDANLEAEFLRQFRRPHSTNDDAALEAADTYLTSERRRMARAAIRLQEDDELFPSLTPHEQQVVEALTTRRQREDSLSRSPAPRSIYYGPSEVAGESRRTTAQQYSLFAQDFSGLSRSTDSSTSTGANTLSLPSVGGEYRRNRQATDTTLSDRPGPFGAPFYNPRRQASILIAASNEAESDSLRASSSRHPPLPPHIRPSSTSFPDWARFPDPNTTDRITLPPTSTTTTTTAERAEALRLRRPSPPPPVDSNPEIMERRRRAIARARERANAGRESERLVYERHQNHLEQRARSRGELYDRSFGLRTAGLAVSWDGRKIWAACDRGIFEYEVNVRGRMMFPAVELR
jgi:WD40 repeat protein